MKNRLIAIIVLLTASHLVTALPALQLGPGNDPNWVYDTSEQSWVLDGPGSLSAYANSDSPLANGSYAWDAAGAVDQWAYLVVAATPKSEASAGDIFDITVKNDGLDLGLFDSGFGNPPLEDTNSMGSHGIFDTWFEIYRFSFDGVAQTILNTQPGESGSGEGYQENFDIEFNWLHEDVIGLHFDLFTVSGDGTYQLGTLDKHLVHSVAPFSHDAEMLVPEPGTLLLLMLGFIGLASQRRHGTG